MNTHPVDVWHELVRTQDPAGLDRLLDDDAVFISPIVHAPQRGKALAKAYLTAAFHVFFNPSFRYVREIRGSSDAMLEFETEIDGIVVNGVDILQWDAGGKIVEFKVMIRPLKAIQLIHERMAAMLAAGGASGSGSEGGRAVAAGHTRVTIIERPEQRDPKSRHCGSCLCGAVRFEVAGDFERFYLCHCEYCRKDTGTAHAANLFSSTASLKWTSGESHVTVFKLPSTRHAKAFCSICGSALPNVQMNGALLVVPAGSLNSEISLRPNAHLFVASRARWDQELENLPMFEGLPA